MRELKTAEITRTVKELYLEASYVLNDDVLTSLEEALATEESVTGRDILGQLLENAKTARVESVPVCQDTGVALVFLELGQDLHITGGDLQKAIDEGIRQGCREGFLRASIVADPLRRENTGDNTPALVHTEIVPGDRLKITVAAKGAGSENMSTIRMMIPGTGPEEITEFVVEWAGGVGANPCPPVIIGVGLGGNFEEAPLRAKKALLLPIGSRNPDPFYAGMEMTIIDRLNQTGIGPGALGGRVTCLDCHILTSPCHIASLPVAINLDCPATRHRTVVL